MRTLLGAAPNITYQRRGKLFLKRSASACWEPTSIQHDVIGRTNSVGEATAIPSH